MRSRGRGFPIAPHSASLHLLSMAVDGIMMSDEAFCHECAELGAQIDFTSLLINK